MTTAVEPKPRRSSRKRRPVTGLLLAPGAGSTKDHSCLVAIEEAVDGLDVQTRRMDFDYRVEGRRAPDRAPKLLAAMARELRTFAGDLGCPVQEIVIGGRSMGGRIASMLAAGDDAVPPGATGSGGEAGTVAGVVLVAYPLHPPGRPERARTAHLPNLRVPSLFISGTRDAFGSPAELEAAVALVAGPARVEWIDGGRHELRGADASVSQHVRNWIGAGLR